MKSFTNTITAGIITLGVVVFSLYVSRIPPFELLELKSIDSRFRVRGYIEVPDTSIAVVYIDNETFTSLPEQWPYPRTYYARAIDNLSEAGAKLIIVDLEFSDVSSEHPIHDRQLAEAIQRAGNVVLAARIVNETGHYNAQTEPYLLPPIELLQETGTPIGIANTVVD